MLPTNLWTAAFVWKVGAQEMQKYFHLRKGEGVYAVWFPRVVKTAEDLAFNFRHVLPELQKKYEEIKSRESAG